MIQEFGGDFAARTPGILKSRVSAITTAVSEAYDTSNFVWFKKWLFEIIGLVNFGDRLIMQCSEFRYYCREQYGVMNSLTDTARTGPQQEIFI